jgi:hypothetical protein
MLMGGGVDPDLRREYRNRIRRILKSRPDPALLQLYARPSFSACRVPSRPGGESSKSRARGAGHLMP